MRKEVLLCENCMEKITHRPVRFGYSNIMLAFCSRKCAKQYEDMCRISAVRELRDNEVITDDKIDKISTEIALSDLLNEYEQTKGGEL